MPYMIKKNDKQQFCVFKQDENGDPTGDSFGCHPSHDMAQKQIEAIYANTKELVQEYVIGEFRGTFPDVPIASGVDLEQIKQLDKDPVFVSLPVIPKIGSVSKNGLLYDEALVNSIEEQINQKRPGGIFGHLKDEDRNTAFPMPSGMWIGAKREGDTLWAKAWISGAAKDYIRQLKAVGGQIATSIYGKGEFEKVKDGVRRLKNFNLESLDFAPPERAALGYGATPHLTTELEQPKQGKDNDMDKAQFLAELTANEVPQTVREQIVDPLRSTISELETKNAALELAVAEFRQKQFEITIDAKVSELTKWEVRGDEALKRLNKFRQTLRAQLLAAVGAERDATKVAELVNGVWEDLKPLAETVRDALAGPAAIVAARVQNGERKLDTSPEAIAKARQFTGI